MVRSQQSARNELLRARLVIPAPWFPTEIAPGHCHTVKMQRQTTKVSGLELTCSNFKAGDFKNNLLFIDKLVAAGLELSLELRGHFLVRGTQERKWSDATTPLRGLL